MSWMGTTILSVRKGKYVVMAGDGQVTMGDTIVKGNVRKVRLSKSKNVLIGYAGATADAITLYERLESKIDLYPGQLQRACVELAKDWRTDKYLRKLEAMIAAADKNVSLIVSGLGDVLEPQDGIIGIGSGGNYAVAAARALINENLSAEEIVQRSMTVASELCIYTNSNVTIEKLETEN
ncbi:ATP-dependent protease subunit HslV [Alphaproteobacteria bacterium]|nr:ATP-dependent protease subunit HslV [Alphaproteobacteria bacterium]